MNFGGSNPIGGSGGSTPAMASTFSLLMKIVRDLALNRDDPEGREHHKHFVEQQFRNSDARMRRVINDCSGDLTTLIQLFDLIIRRVDRSRREVSACLFSIRNCKQLLLLRRAECRRLWFQCNEQKTLVQLYDRLIELRTVRQRCQQYVFHGYLVHASCLVQRAMDVILSEGKKLRQTSDDRTSESEEYSSTSIPTSSDGKFLQSAPVKWASNQSKSLLPHSKELNEDCLSQLKNEMIELGEDLLHSLQLTLELCLFESQQGVVNVSLAENWSSRLQEFWKGKNNRLLSFDNNSSRLQMRKIDDNQLSSQVDSSPQSQHKCESVLPEPLSFEVDRSSLAKLPSLHSISGSVESCLELVMEAAERLTFIPNTMDRLLQHLMDILPRRLDNIAVEESASVLFCISNDNFAKSSDNSGSSMLPSHEIPKQSALSMLLSNIFHRYDQIVESCKLLYSSSLARYKRSPPAAAVMESESVAANNGLSLTMDYHHNMSYLWSTVQRPLAAVLLTHLIVDLPAEVQKINFSVREFEVDSARGFYFNSDLVLEMAFKHHLNKSSDASQTLVVHSDHNSQDTAMDDMSIDLDLYFFDPDAVISTGVPTTNSALGQSSGHKTPPILHDAMFQQHRKINYGGSGGGRSTNAHSRLFRFDKSAQVQSLSEYYQDVGHHQLLPAHSRNTQLEEAQQQQQQQQTMDMNAALMGLKSVTVCNPSYRNIHHIYPKLSQICELIDTRVHNDCFQSSTADIDRNSTVTHSAGSHDIHLTLFKDTVLEFVRDIFVVQLRNDVRRKISEGLPALLRPTELLPTVEGKADKTQVPILFYTFLSMQAIEELLAALFDIPTHCSQLWIAINEIVLQHRANSTNLFTATLVTTPLSVEWVRDVDVNRHLRSMPTLKQLLMNWSQGKKTVLSAAVDSARRKSLSTSGGNFSVKEAETILLNLTKEELNSSERMITDYRQTRLIAYQHESMMWFVGQFRATVRRHKQQMSASAAATSLKNRIESESVMSSVDQTERLAEDILLVLFVEIRVHCFYHLMLLANPNNLLQYASRPSICCTDPSSLVDYRNEDLQAMYVYEDSTIQSLVRDLFRLQESLLGALSLDKIDFLFDGLGYLIATVFIELVGKLSLLDDAGLLKMRRNILSVHNCLLGLMNQRRQRRYSLANDDRGNEMFSSSSINEPSTTNQDSDRSSSEKSRKFQQYSSATDSDGQELLRALHFYDLLTCSNVESLVERIGQESKRGSFCQQDYVALVSLKYRMDRQRLKAKSEKQTAHVAESKPDDDELQSILNKLSTYFDQTAVKPMQNTFYPAN